MGTSWVTQGQMAPQPRLAVQADASQAAVDAALSLHSRASSSKKIYLDFDGFDVKTGTAWADNGVPTGVKGGFSMDADPAFSQPELDYITTVWKVMAEKYSPFEIDVTTAFQTDDALSRTSSGDTEYGTHVVFTDDQTARPSNCSVSGCAGVAWISVFNRTATLNRYAPAWVFTTLSFGQQSAGQAANSAAHETGHTLGLRHDVTHAQPSGYYGGHDNWSPIMGSSNRAVQQFDNNGYDDAYTPNQVDPVTGDPDPDDFDVMTKTGAGYRGDTEDGALGAQSSYVVDGVITTAADTDTFTVDRSSCTSDLVVGATGVGLGQTLDIELTVSRGGTSSISSPVSGTGPESTVPKTPSGMNAGLTIPGAAAGIWTVKVDGVGDATNGYTDYGSVGQYHLTISGCPSGPDAAPAAPTGLASSQITKTKTASLSWIAPADTGSSSLTGYRITGVPGAPITVGPGVTSTTLTGLSVGTGYNVGVTAINSVGDGPTANVALTMQTYIPTTAPTVKATVTGTSVKTTWTVPSNTGGAVLHSWDVRYYKSGVDTYLEPQLPASTTSWTRKLPVGSWKVVVTPNYTAGDTTNLKTGSTTFKVVTVPSAPKIGTAASGASGGSVNALARWGVPTTNGGSTITGYRVYAYRLSSTGAVISSKYSTMRSASSRSYTFPLAAGRYKFRVVAYNAVGKSSYSSYSGTVTAR